tara:strand:- start:178 stop:1065 length:888 start_codon:yes stop_codon:yes gene_type:complete
MSKIIDCVCYLDEDMLLDLRLNVLNEHVSHFIICEATFNHKGLKKKLNFDFSNFKKFKDKITYIVLDKEPHIIRKISENDKLKLKNSKILDNSINRDIAQRNYLNTKIQEFNDDDLIIINDIDEIPNLNLFSYKSKITIFKQKMFYYKFNLLYPELIWSGSRICKKKHLLSPQWLRNIKTKNYPWYRFDTIFSKKKYRNINFIEDGGWHFSNIKKPEEIDFKMRNFAHHLEYEESGLDAEKIKKSIIEKKVFYNHFADKSDSNKLSHNAKLVNLNTKKLPKYLYSNLEKYSKWID